MKMELIPDLFMIMCCMVTQDWCDLQGSRLRLLGGYIIRLAQRTANAKLLICLLDSLSVSSSLVLMMLSHDLRLPEVKVLKCLFYAARGFHNTVDMQILANGGVDPGLDDNDDDDGSEAVEAAAREVAEEQKAMQAAGFDWGVARCIVYHCNRLLYM